MPIRPPLPEQPQVRTMFIASELFRGGLHEKFEKLGWRTLRFPEEFPRSDEAPPPSLFLLHENAFLFQFSGLLDRLFLIPDQHPVIIVGTRFEQEYLADLFGDRPLFQLSDLSDMKQVQKVLKRATEAMKNAAIKENYEKLLDQAQYEIRELHAIGIALSSEKDPIKLLDLILTKSRQITQADAGSLFLVEGGKKLKLKHCQNDSLRWNLSEDIPLPIDDRSIAGYVALTGHPLDVLDVYLIPEDFPYKFNLTFDQESGYRTKSMLVVAIKNPAGEILGVIELINKCRDFKSRRVGEPLKPESIIPFIRKDRDLLSCLASQAGVALENSRLIEDIKHLFEGFVKASVTAIEARDPTTSGHSERVAAMTVALAQTVSRLNEGPFKDVRFDDVSLTEIRYASLLHDFGKVGVREEVLVKAKKLFPWELDSLVQRYRLIRKSLEADFYKKCLDQVIAQGIERFQGLRPVLESEFHRQLDDVQAVLDFLVTSNEPTVLEEGNFQRLLDLAQRRFRDSDGVELEMLSPREAHVLSIRKGSLSEAERLEIESHVNHTFNFLSKIPWTRQLQRIPEIALSHHEKLNGRGYPNHLVGKLIPLESKLLTVCDIYDALTAKDRPYKRSIPHQKAFDIMYQEARQGLIDEFLLDTFVKAEIYKTVETRRFNEGRDFPKP